MAQQRRGTESASVGDAIDVEVGLLEQTPGVEHPLVGDPLHGGASGLLDEPAGEGARRHVGPRRKRRHRVLLVEVGQHPIQLRSKTFRVANRDRLVDVLALPAVALRGDDHPAGDLVGHLRTQLPAHQMQAGVDTCGGARAGDQVAVVDEQHVSVHPSGGVGGGQVVGMHPVRGTRPAVEQARGTGQERARTHRQDGRAGFDGPSHRSQRLGQVVRSRDCRDRDQIGTDQFIEPVIGSQGGAHRGANRFAGTGTAHLEVEVRDAVGRAVDAEDLADHTELENR